jgi:hypothetical protein
MMFLELNCIGICARYDTMGAQKKEKKKKGEREVKKKNIQA